MPMRTRRTSCFVALLLGLLALAPAGAAPAPRSWSSGLLHSAEAWTDRMNGALVSADALGLRVEIAPGKKWAIAALPNVALPEGVGSVRVRVRALQGGRWLMRLYGDLRGSGTPDTVGVFQGVGTAGPSVSVIDPRMLRLAHHPSVQLQLGLEGQPGAHVVFESVEFLPRPAAQRPPTIPGQIGIECVDLMPNLPQPFKMRDWRALARAYDRFVFDFHAQGEYLPLIWLDDSRINLDGPTFGLYSYVGDKRQGKTHHEGINCIGAVLGATLAGIDKSRQEHDYVRMCEAYFNRKNGSRLVLNDMDQGTGSSFWYEIWPHVLFYALADRYPGHGNLDAILRATAGRWLDACRALEGADGVPNFEHTAFNFATMKPVDNGEWKEPDAAAGVAWLQYMAFTRTGKLEHLEAADDCLRFLQRRKANPYYELLMPWGALAAARMNAEAGREYDVPKMVEWCFGISESRGGWGVTAGNWGGYDCGGLVGSVDNGGGYAFALSTFAQAGALVPLVRYDPRFARAVGKWMLNLANAARLFYPTELPADHQSSAFWKGDPKGVIAYEGLRREWDGKSPYATGDPLAMKWGPATDLGLYGSSYVGFLGGIIRRTGDERILMLDCLATDFFHGPAYPTSLCYNPYPQAKEVAVTVGSRRCDVYDAVTDRFLARRVAGKARVRIPGDRAVLLVFTPPGGKLTREHGRVTIDGAVVRYGLRDQARQPDAGGSRAPTPNAIVP